jgi:hypothetical protein
MRIHRWCRWRWVFPALVALGLIGVVGGCTTVQNDVQARTRDALAANGLTGVTVTGSYRDVTLTGPESERAEATALARALEAAHQVTYVGTAAGATPTAGPTAPSPSVTKTPAAGLAAVGHGVANPVADNATSEGRAQNRRIEFTIVGA